MKKVFLVMLILGSLGLYGQTDDQQLLEDFANSADYRRFISSSQFASNGALNLPGSNVVYEKHPDITGKSVPVLNINFTESVNGGTKIVGQIQALKVRDDYGRLPQNARYLMLYRDYRQYDHNTKTGTIKVYDLNYDEYQAGIADIINGNVGPFEIYPMPPIIADKYGFEMNKAHPCDNNKNGDVSYGECWRCMVTACVKDHECALLCLIGNMGFLKGQCHISFAIACSWIAIHY